MMVGLVLIVDLQNWGVPLMPRTSFLMTKYLTATITNPLNFWVMVPLLIIFFSGELVWRERDARLSENVDATPVPDWVLFVGKFLGLALVIVALMAVVMLVGVLRQVIYGYHDFQIGQYLQILFGIQLLEFLLFAALAFTIVAVVNQKYLGQLRGTRRVRSDHVLRRVRRRAQPAGLWSEPRVVLHGHARLRRDARAVAVV